MLLEKLWLLPDRNFNIISINKYLSYSEKEMSEKASPFLYLELAFFAYYFFVFFRVSKVFDQIIFFCRKI